MDLSRFAPCRLGRERLTPGTLLQRHRHATGYVAVVLEGGYLEAGDEGRSRLQPGDVLVHRAFEAHLDLVGPRGAQVLNLPLPQHLVLPPGFRVADPDLLAREAERDPQAAAGLLSPHGAAAPCSPADWPDQLAAALRAAPELQLSHWAAQHHLAPATLSRGFQAVYGVTPARYRAEARSRQAFDGLCRGTLPFAQLAAEHGFADQAHFCRAIRQLTGAPPSAWRSTSNPFKTGAGPHP